MATMTIAQALVSTESNITIADTPVNIAQAVSNSALMARISLAVMSGNGASGAGDALLLASLGAKFSKGGFRYTVRDPIASLTDPANAAGVALATVTSVFDTAAHLLAAVGTPVMTGAGSVLLSAGASVSLANLTILQALRSFSVLPGQSITIADTAANLLALAPSQMRPSIRFFTVAVNSTVPESAAISLLALPGFSVASGVTLTVSGSLAGMTTSGVLGQLPVIAAVSGIVINVADSFAALVAGAAALGSVRSAVAALTVTIAASVTLSAAELTVVAFNGFGVASGQVVTVADSAANLIALAPHVAALAHVTQLASDATVTVSQLSRLLALRVFSANGHALTAEDTVAAMRSFPVAGRSVASAIVVHDSVANLLTAGSLPTGTTSVVGDLGAAGITAAQAASLAGLATGGAVLSLLANGSFTSLAVNDTARNLVGAQAAIASLLGAGPVTVSMTEASATVTVAGAAGLVAVSVSNLSTAVVTVADTGAALTAAAPAVFAADFASIVVTSGVFAGTIGQLLDARLHFGAPSDGLIITFAVIAHATLAASTTGSADQAVALSLLPGFTVATGVTLTIAGTADALISAASAIMQVATDVQVTGSAVMTAGDATILAGIKAHVGAGHFVLAAGTLTMADTPAAILPGENAAGLALVSAVMLSDAASVDASDAGGLVALGGKFTLGGFDLTVIDTAANLAALGSVAGAVNAWHGQVLLAADATVTVAQAVGLRALAGFSGGSHVLTIADTAGHLLAPGDAATVAAADVVTLSDDATVTVAQAAQLTALHGFTPGPAAMTIAGTPVALAELAAPVAALASSIGFVTRTVGNAAAHPAPSVPGRSP